MRNQWIFDWSGTLVDDMGLVVDATNYVLKQYGKPAIDRDEFRENFCLPYRDFYKIYLPGENMEEIESHFRRGFSISKVPVTVLPHAREFLHFLLDSGAELYILTSMCAKAFAEQVVDLGMEDYFTETYSGVLDKRELIGEIIENHGMDKCDTVFVGDMKHDIETAHHGGIMSVGVVTGYNRASVLATSEPTVMVKDLSVMEEVLSDHVVGGSWMETFEKPAAVKIRGLEVPTFIGVPDEERAEQQTLKVHVDMHPKVGFRELNDEIDGGVDYYQVSLRIKSLALEKPRKLIETLAVDMADMIKADFAVESVRVEIEKYILPDTDSVGVEVVR